MAKQGDTNLVLMASALISVGALAACGDDTPTVSYSDEITGEQMPEPALAAREQCYGVALAQYNDCATKKLTDCAGTADKDYLPDKWQYVPAGTCAERGGALEAKARKDDGGR